jgi:hypothetical protein
MQMRIILASTLAMLLIATGATANPGQITQPLSLTAQGAYTPPPGSAERKAIADAYRAKWKQGGNTITDVVFVITYLKVRKGWAWLEVKPQSSDGSQQYEAEQGLLRKTGGKWRVSERTAGYDAAYFQKLRKKYPSVPANIFPSSSG